MRSFIRKCPLLPIRVLLCLLLAFLALGQSAWATQYYFNATPVNNLTSTSNWWTVSGGSGTHPANFTTSGDTFEIQANALLAAAVWTLGASGSPVNLIVDAGASLTCNTATTNNIWGTVTVGGTIFGKATANDRFAPKSDVTVNSGGSITMSGLVTIGGNFICNGTYSTTNSGALTVMGTATVGGTLNQSGGSGSVTLNNSLTIGTGGAVTMGVRPISVAGATTINGTGKITGSGANTFSGDVTINGTGTNTSGATTFGGNLTVGDGTNAASLALSGDSSVAGNFTVATNITYTSAYALNVTGTTTVKGTLALGAGGSLNNTTNLWIANGGTFDVSSTNSYTLGASTLLQASGINGSPATIKGGGSVSLGSQPITLKYTPVTFNGDSISPALTLSQGDLILSNALTVNIGGNTLLGAGSYMLISVGGGTITGIPTLVQTIGPGGDGLENRPATLDLSTPGQLKLVVPGGVNPVQLSRNAGANPAIYGDTLTFRAVLSPDPGDGATVTFKTNGAVLGTATTTSGVAELTVNNLAASSNCMVTATAAGHSTGLLADNPQVVVPKVLTLFGAAAQSKYYDGLTNAILTGTLDSPEAFGSGTSGDGKPYIGATPTLNCFGAFATVGPGTGIAVTATITLGGSAAGNYSLIQPTGLTADIHLAACRVETAADGSGTVVTQSLTAGQSVTVYAIARGVGGAFLGNVSASWSLSHITGFVKAGDLSVAPDGKSATFTAGQPGSAKIRAQNNFTAMGTSDRISVVLVSGASAGSALTGPVDEPYWLPAQTHTNTLLFTTPSVKRNANPCPTAVFNGNVYTVYALPADTNYYGTNAPETGITYERMMVAKIPLDGSTPVIQPLVQGTNTTVRGYFLSGDNHCTWTLEVDRAGYIHVSGDLRTHKDGGHWRSASPEDISSFTEIIWYAAPPGTPLPFPITDGATFPHIWKDRKGQVFWSVQQSPSYLPFCSYDETTQLWTSLGGVKPAEKGEITMAWTPDGKEYDSPTDTSAFKASWFVPVWDSNNRMHMLIGMLDRNTYNPHPASLGTTILYAYSDDGGKTAFRSDGTQIQYPIRASGPAANIGDIVIDDRQDDPEYNWLNRCGAISLDKADRPMIEVKDYPTGTHIFRLEDGVWVDHPDYNFNGTSGSPDPSGVRITHDDSGFTRCWNPGTNGTDMLNSDFIATPAPVQQRDEEHYRDTGELVWNTLVGSTTYATLTFYRTVFDPVCKVTGVDLQASTTNQGTMSGDIAGGFHTGLTNGAWNALTGPVSTVSTSATSQSLAPMDGSATANPVKVTLGGGAGESFIFDNWTAVTNTLRGDGIKLDTTTGNYASILVSGLLPGKRYDLALFGAGYDDPMVIFNGIPRLADGVFKDVPADTNGNILGYVARSGTNLNARLSGLQIQGIFAAPPTNDVAFPASGDAYVSQSNAGVNYGTLTYLNVKAPVGGAGQMDAYLQFDVSTVDPATIAHAILKVYSQTVAANIRLYQAATNTWSQSGITWNNAPGLMPPVQLLSQAVAAPNSWVSFDVTSAVQSNNGTCSFVLLSDGTTAQQFTSKEGGANAPVLMISQGVYVPPPPVSFSFSPANTATWVAPDANLTATFDQLIFRGSGAISIVRSSDDAIVETFDVATSPQLAFSGATLTIDPTAALSPGTDYHVLVATGAVVGVTDIPYAGITDSATWSFRTFVLNTLPYHESFEAYAAGEVWLADGVFTQGNSNHWTGSAGTLATIVTNAYPWTQAYPLPGENHTNVLRVVSGTVTNQLVSSDKSVLVDFMIQPTLDEGIVEAQSQTVTNQQFAAFFSTNGLIHIRTRDLAGGTNRWTQLTHAPLASNAWVRMRVRMIYDSAGSGTTYFTIRLNDGVWLEHADGFADVNGAPAPSTPGGRWFAAPSSAAQHISSVGFGNSWGSFSLDDLSVYALVDGIFKDTPTVTWPTASEIAVGQTLQKVRLLGGAASNAAAEVAGTFHFVPALETVVNSAAPYDVEFAPGSVNYFAVSGSVFVTALAGVYTTGTHTIPISFYANAGLSPGDQGVATFEELDLLDSDGDGVTNWQEYIAGTNPKNSNSVFRVTGITARPDLTVKWIGGTRGPTIPYVVEAATSLGGTPGAWADLSNSNGRVEGTNTFSSSKTNNLLFIRIRATQE